MDDRNRLPALPAQGLTRRALLRLGLVAAGGGLAAACQPAATPAKPGAAAPGAPASAGGAAAPAATSAPAARPMATARIGIIAGVLENAFLYLGIDRGLFRESGVEPEVLEFQDGGTALRALLANEIDLMDAGPQAVFPAIEKGSAIRLIGASRPKLAFGLYARREIEQVSDLFGKDVGIAGPGSFLHLLMLALAQERGLDPNRFNFVNVGSSVAVWRAVAAGKVAAGPAGVEFIPATEADPSMRMLLLFDDVIPSYIRVGLLARESDVQQRPALLESLLLGWARTYRYGLENKEPWVDLAVRKFEKSRADAEWNWNFERDNLVVSPDLDIDERAIEYMQALNVRVGSQSRILPFDQVATRQIQQRVIQQLGRWQPPA